MQVGSAGLAQAAVRAGVDAVIAQGCEAGGSNQSVASVMTLVPAVVDAVAPVMVLAAWGIVDGRGMAAALALGAAGVWVGTRLVASEEADAHEEYKRRVLLAAEGDTTITTLFHGPERIRRPMRALGNRVVRTWAGHEIHLPPDVGASHVIGWTGREGEEVPVHKFSTLLPTPETTGDFDEMCLLAGEGAALVRDVQPAGRIVGGMAAQADQIIGGLLGVNVPGSGSLTR